MAGCTFFCAGTFSLKKQQKSPLKAQHAGSGWPALAVSLSADRSRIFLNVAIFALFTEQASAGGPPLILL